MRALWIGTFPGEIRPEGLQRHAGSRGPLTLAHVSSLPDGQGSRWWIFYFDDDLGWEAPTLGRWGDGLLVHPPHGVEQAWTLPVDS